MVAVRRGMSCLANVIPKKCDWTLIRRDCSPTPSTVWDVSLALLSPPICDASPAPQALSRWLAAAYRPSSSDVETAFLVFDAPYLEACVASVPLDLVSGTSPLYRWFQVSLMLR